MRKIDLRSASVRRSSATNWGGLPSSSPLQSCDAGFVVSCKPNLRQSTRGAWIWQSLLNLEGRSSSNFPMAARMLDSMGCDASRSFVIVLVLELLAGLDWALIPPTFSMAGAVLLFFFWMCKFIFSFASAACFFKC